MEIKLFFLFGFLLLFFIVVISVFVLLVFFVCLFFLSLTNFVKCYLCLIWPLKYLGGFFLSVNDCLDLSLTALHQTSLLLSQGYLCVCVYACVCAFNVCVCVCMLSMLKQIMSVISIHILLAQRARSASQK